MGKFADKLGRTLRTLVPTRHFRCPSHYCHSCYGVDAKSNKSRSTACIRCCISFHEKCQPQGHFAKIAGTRQYVCNSHSLTEPTLKEHIEEEN